MTNIDAKLSDVAAGQTTQRLRSLLRTVGIVAAAVLLSLLLIGVETLNYLEQRARADASAAVTTTNTAVRAAIDMWLDVRLNVFQKVTQKSALLGPNTLVTDTQLSELPPELTVLPSLTDLVLKPLGHLGIDAASLLDAQGKLLTSTGMTPADIEVLASTESQNRLMDLQQAAVLNHSIHRAGPGVSSAVSTHLYFAAPLKRQDGTVERYVVARILTDLSLAPLTAAGRLGASGETYVVDREGRLVTDSRFLSNVVGTSVVALDADNVADQSSESLPQLTVSASRVIAGETGSTTRGYADYRGVAVLGAWNWMDTLELGLITEIDESEALAAYEHTFNAFVALTTLITTFLGGLMALLFYLSSRQRAVLEQQVARRTQQLSKAQADEERLRKKYDLILDDAQMGIVEVDAAGTIQFCNRAGASLLGYEQDVLIGQNFHSTAHHSHADGSAYPREQCPSTRAMQTGVHIATENEVFWRRDGRPFEIAYATTPLIEDGEPVGAMIVFRDISAQLGMERELIQREQELSSILDMAPDPMLVVNTAGTILQANFRTGKVFGYDDGSLIGENIDKLVPPSSQSNHPALRQQFIEIASAAMNQSMNHTVGGRAVEGLRCDGSLVPLEIALCSVEVSNEIRVIVAARDVTERQAFENALRTTRERLSAAVVAGNLAMWEFDFDQQSLSVTPELFSMRGYEPEEFMQKPVPGVWGTLKGLPEIWDRMIHPDDLLPYQKALNEHLKSKNEFFKYEYRWQHADGSFHWVLNTGQVVERDDTGKARKLVGVIADIDSMKNLQLQYAAATKAKSDFLAKVTHEIRTPLSALMGLLELAQRTSDEARANQYLNTANRSVDYMTRIINDILDFSKIEAGKLTLEHIDFDLKTTLEQCRALLQTKASEFDVTLELLLQDSVPVHLRGDPYRLQQIVINLAGNAIKFSPPGSKVELSVEPLPSDADAVQLRFAVRDWGIGLTPEEQSRLFQSYEQASTATTRTHGGTGLGLAICRQLTDLMGGEIWVRSIKGQGSTFYFTARFGIEDDLSPEVIPITPPSKDDATLSGLRVLVAEDNLDNQDVVRELLALEDIETVVVSNGAEAIEALNTGHFDGVLMDCQMPVMTGFEATQAIRQDPRFTDLPIIAMTGNTSAEDIAATKAAGMTGHMAKPIHPEILLQMIADHFR